MKSTTIIHVLISIIMLLPILYRAQQSSKDFLEKSYNLSLEKFSENGKWIIARKLYKKDKDTTLLINTVKENIPVRKFFKMSSFDFLEGNKLLVSGTGTAVLFQLKNENQISYSNIKNTGILNKGKQYFLFTESRDFDIYNNDGKRIQGIPQVINYFVNIDGSKIYLLKKEGNVSQIIDVSNGTPKVLYITDHDIKKIELSASGKYLCLTEVTRLSKMRQAVLIRTADGSVIIPDIPEQEIESAFSFAEIQNGQSFIITSDHYISAEKGLVEIWRTADTNLEAKQFGKNLTSKWIWTSYDKRTRYITGKQFPSMVCLDNPRYYLAFNLEKNREYNQIPPYTDLNLYDLETGLYKKIARLKAEIYISKKGKFLLSTDQEGNWVIYEIAKNTKTVLGSKNLRNPTFTADNKFVYFNSDNDIWKYDIQKDQLMPTDLASDRRAAIVNQNLKTIYSDLGMVCYLSTIEERKPLLVSIFNMNSNDSNYLVIHNGQKKKILEKEDYYLPHMALKYNPSFEKLCLVRENLSTPPQIVFRNTHEKHSKILYQSNIHDTGASFLKKVMVDYTNSEGRFLKGILYYPANFNEKRSYPMVVHIYQIQSLQSNRYLGILNDFPIGINIRALLEDGYFVYLPDIGSSTAGVGVAALNCVNIALDALVNNHNINWSKVGLIGHSFGGYQTNFIAAHSKRFAAFVSGAGAVDIVRMYFSYNYTSFNPFYWQFESGQMNMHIPFSQNKELYLKNNPILNVEKVNAPILLWTGKDDKRIEWQQTMEFYIGLQRNKKEAIALFYPDNAHTFQKSPAANKDLQSKIMDWWNYYLKDGTKPEWMNEKGAKN